MSYINNIITIYLDGGIVGTETIPGNDILESDDLIIVKLADDGDSVMRVEKDKLSGYLKKGWEKIK